MEEQVINAVFRREEVWNPRNKNHKNVYVLQKKWMDIANEVGQDVKAVKNKWKYLRDYFQRECKRFAKPGAGEDEKLESTWQYFHKMLFIKDACHSGNNVSNLRETDDADETNDEEKYDIHVNDSRLPSPISPAPSMASIPSSTKSASPFVKKIKLINKEEMLKIEKRKLELLEEEAEKEDDEDLHFFKSLLNDIKTLPPWRKRRLKLKMHQLVVEEVEEAERYSEVANVRQPPQIPCEGEKYYSDHFMATQSTNSQQNDCSDDDKIHVHTRINYQ